MTKKDTKVGPGGGQHREFVKAARELGCDESEEAFDKVLKRVASAPPPKSVQKRKKRSVRRSKPIRTGRTSA